jgi:hypothetical protein
MKITSLLVSLQCSAGMGLLPLPALRKRVLPNLRRRRHRSPRRRGSCSPPPLFPCQGHGQAEAVLHRALRQDLLDRAYRHHFTCSQQERVGCRGGQLLEVVAHVHRRRRIRRARQCRERKDKSLASGKVHARRRARPATTADARRTANGRAGSAGARPGNKRRTHDLRVPHIRALRGSAGRAPDLPRRSIPTTAPGLRARRSARSRARPRSEGAGRPPRGSRHRCTSEPAGGRTRQDGRRARPPSLRKDDARHRASAEEWSSPLRSRPAPPSARPCGSRATPVRAGAGHQES